MNIVSVYEEVKRLSQEHGYELIYSSKYGWVRPFVSSVITAPIMRKVSKELIAYLDQSDFYPKKTNWSNPTALSLQEAYNLLVLNDPVKMVIESYPNVDVCNIGDQIYWRLSNRWRPKNYAYYIPVSNPVKVVDNNLRLLSVLEEDILKAVKVCKTPQQFMLQATSLRFMHNFDKFIFAYPEELKSSSDFKEMSKIKATLKKGLGSHGMVAHTLLLTEAVNRYPVLTPVLELGVKAGFKSNYITLTSDTGERFVHRDQPLFDVNKYIAFLSKHFKGD